MANESDLEDDDVANDMPAMESAAALGLALAVASRERADAFLDAQTAIAHLQREHLHEQRTLQISHLKWRRFNDWARAGWQVMLGAVGALVVVAIATALWDASHADGLLVDAFSVPPDFEQHGLGGDVIAGDITDRIASVRRIAMAHSYSVSRGVTKDRAKEIKVEIPDTGISISETWRYLRSWLGHERHLTGNLREAGDGAITLAVSLDGGGAISASGVASDLPSLERRVAESVFGAFDPVNYVNYLSSVNRYHDAYRAAQQYVPVAQTTIQRADSYALLSYTSAYATGDLHMALARARLGVGIDPSIAVAHVMAARFDFYLGHDEDMLAEARTILSLRDEDQPQAHQGGGFDEMKDQAKAQIALFHGDFAEADKWDCGHSCTLSETLLARSMFAARLHDQRTALSLLNQGLAADKPDPGRADDARYYLDAEKGDWNAAVGEARGAWAAAMMPNGDMSAHFLDADASINFVPLLAVADARTGHFAEAHAAIDRMPGDCVPCETARGEIDRLLGNLKGAAWWFARVIHDGPSIPFAYADWGAMLLAKGDTDAAIAKFREANLQGPHFADPLEMWGEALMLKNRSDLALAKFEEADKYAPNWGRLRLKWGEALFFAGRKDDARKQFAIAAGLDLSDAERTELGRSSTRG